jgi:polar amino acid transport system permease protein
VIAPTLAVVGDYVNSMFKISALVSVIGVGDLFNAAITAGNSTYRYLEPPTLAGLLYLGVSVPLTIALRLAGTRVAAPWESHAA